MTMLHPTTLHRLLTAALWAALAGCALPAAGRSVLCTTFPIFQITRNVAQGREGVTVGLLLPPSLGCPHHYSLTPHDMRKLALADMLVVNGLGLEEFLGTPVRRANPGLHVIDSSDGAESLLPAEGGPRPDRHGPHAAGPEGRSGLNPHLFASPRRAARIALRIARELSRLDSEGAELYLRNGRAYAERLNGLADEMATLVAQLANRRIVQPHGVFDYLAQDIGLEVVAVTQPHGLEPSAAELLALVRTIRERKAGAVFWEPQYSPNVARMIARETDIPAAVLDPAASGPADAPLDYYEQVMRQNMNTLRETLGHRPE